MIIEMCHNLNEDIKLKEVYDSLRSTTRDYNSKYSQIKECIEKLASIEKKIVILESRKIKPNLNLDFGGIKKAITDFLKSYTLDSTIVCRGNDFGILISSFDSFIFEATKNINQDWLARVNELRKKCIPAKLLNLKSTLAKDSRILDDIKDIKKSKNLLDNTRFNSCPDNENTVVEMEKIWNEIREKEKSLPKIDDQEIEEFLLKAGEPEGVTLEHFQKMSEKVIKWLKENNLESNYRIRTTA